MRLGQGRTFAHGHVPQLHWLPGEAGSKAIELLVRTAVGSSLDRRLEAAASTA